MPQPLSRVRADANIHMANAGTRPLAHNPELGLLAMEAIISWSNVEQFMLHTYITLMGGPNELAAVGYMAIEGQSPKTAMIKAIARFKLEPRYYNLLDAILDVAKTSEKTRNKLAHWIWGYSPEIPDGLLLRDQKDDGTTPQNREKIFVYKRNDFEETINRNDRICGYGLKFSFILMNHPANREDRLYQELCAEPEIRDKLALRHPSTP